ncbi:ras-related protein Rab-34-like [Tubulanus polymorphus]|uniref:ras-related protein Rab-34-like n=1 Tax=Tubulanus polymorphus TaxID=672921 RepID=UPI003DA2426C
MTSKLMSSVIASDRIISKYPQPLYSDATPYPRLNFHPKVRSACSQDKTGAVGLKISKIVVVGDIAVGKTSLVNRFIHDKFDRDYKATIGVDFEVEKFSVLTIPFHLQIWDTAGQERFKCIAASYYRGAQVVVSVFELNNRFSLENSIKWMNDACENTTDPLKFLVGTKKDLVCGQVFEETIERAKEISKQLNAELWVCSSKDSEYVKDFFFRLATLTFESAVLRELERSENAPSRTIGADLVKIDRQNEDLFMRDQRKPTKVGCINCG